MKYMVCVDDSDGAQKALERTAQVSKPEDHVTLVSAYTMPSDQHVIASWGQTWDENAVREKKIAQSQELLEKAKVKLIKEGCLSHLSFKAAGGTDARQTLLEAAQSEEVDCIIVGSRGMGTLGSLLLGSVATFLVHHAVKQSVLVVR